MRFLDNKGIDTDDIILINIIYHKPSRETDWIDYLDVIYKEISTGKKKCLVIKEPEMEVYFVEDEYRTYTYNKAFIELDKCYTKKIPCKNIEMGIAKEAGENYIRLIKECKETRNFGAVKNVHKWRYVFGSDFDIETYFRVQYALEYESDDKPKRVTKQFADIEVDSIDIVGFPRDGICPINAISLVEFKVKNLKKELNLENTGDKIKFLNEIAKILSKVENTMEREIYIEKIAKGYNISKEALFAEKIAILNGNYDALGLRDIKKA